MANGNLVSDSDVDASGQARILPPAAEILRSQHNGTSHPLAERMALIGVRVSGNTTKFKAYLRTQQTSFLVQRELPRRSRTNTIYRNAFRIVVEGKWMEFIHLRIMC